MKNRKNNEQSLKGRNHGLDFKGISIYNTSNKMFADRIMVIKLLGDLMGRFESKKMH